MTEPVLVAEQARLAVGGAPALAELTMRTRGERIALGGDATALIGALLGTARQGYAPDGREGGERARLVAGSLRLLGADVGRGAHHTLAGLAPLDPPLPSGWTLEDYLRAGARLAGASARQARDAAGATLEQLGLTRGRKRLLRTAQLAERRAAVIAQAVVAEPRVLVAEAPLSGLDPRAAAFVVDVLQRATVGRAAVLSFARMLPPGPESELCAAATDLCWLGAGRLLLHAEPRELLGGARWLELTVASHAEELRQELSALGIRLEGGPQHYLVVLPPPDAPSGNAPLGITTVLSAAARARAPVVRCVPAVA
jgi:ABC-type branched-subunit amino acid transport system ATPase component